MGDDEDRALLLGNVRGLENGYLHSTPPGDNLLFDYACGEADCFAAVAVAGGGRVAHDETLGLRLCDLGSASPFGNAAHLTRPIGEAAIPALVAALGDFFGAAAGGPFLLFAPWPIADLVPHGFHLVGHPPLMLRAPTTPAPTTTTGLGVVEVQTHDELAHFEQTLVEAYPAPELQPWTRHAFLAPDLLATKWRLFVGYDGDRCVATAAAWPCESVTIVEQVSVRPECRGKGYGAAITAAATLAVPGQTAMLISSDLGRSIYDQLGYAPLLRYTLWIGTRPAQS